MKKIYFIAILLFPVSLFADTVVFDKIFGGRENDFASSIQQTRDGGYIVAGQTDSFGNGSSLYPDMWVIKLDTIGNTEWEKTFGEREKGDGAFSVQQTADEGYIVAGTTSSYREGYPSMWIIKLETTGDTVWTKMYEGAVVSSARSVQQTIDGGYIVAGKGEENILKVDRHGNREWGTHFGWILYSVKQTTNGGYIAVGDSIYHQLEWNYIPSLSINKLDENGDTEWRNPFGDDFIGRANSIQQTTDGGYILAGDSVDFRSEFEYSHYLMVMKLDENGNTEWKYFGGEYSGAQSIQQTEDDGYIVAGNTTDAGHGLDVLIMKLDENGNEQWMKIYGSSGGWEYASSIQQTSDGGYIVAGQTDSYGSGLYDMWILKLDENGNGPGPDGISDSNQYHCKGFSLSQNYPNPFNPETEIAFTLPEASPVTVTVYNILGQVVMEQIKGNMKAGYHTVTWNASGMNSGVYFYRLQASEFTATRRMVLVK
jgi:hypothetical protein